MVYDYSLSKELFRMICPRGDLMDYKVKKWNRKHQTSSGTERVLESTLNTLRTGHYWYKGKRVYLKNSLEKMRKSKVLLPHEIYDYFEDYGDKQKHTKCKITVQNMDTFDMAEKMCESNQERVAVLNFACPIEAGGGVRRGAVSQEETLCLRSSLLESLENANDYYTYNRSLKHTFVASDAIIISENVEVFRNSDYGYRKSPFQVDILSCAAPFVSPFSHCLENYTKAQMEELWFQRISCVILTLIKHSYRYVVLGAWGSGAYNNDPRLVAHAYQRVFDAIGIDGYFDEVCFAIKGEENLKIYKEVFQQI